ncbi:granule associated Rac and RHOG effector protein 1-like [Ptychodera flava]|uniref:granule associated Rac and RHOG effector protein 1-like n=1 Tax=Ptychodera flava TaxID=63121 RepID=UPI00396A3F0C
MAGLKKQLFSSSKQPKPEPTEHQSRSLFHTSMPDSFKSQLEGVQHYSSTYLDALDVLCESAAKLSDTFVSVFRNTPFWEASVQLQQISQDISSATTCVSSQVRDDAVALVTSLMEKDGDAPPRNDENLQVLAKCFLCMLQTQIQFFSTAMEMMAPLSKYNDMIDIIQEYEDNPTMKDVCHSWLAASQSTSILRRGGRVTSDEVQLLVVNQDNTDPEPKIVEVKNKYDACLQRYKYELSGLAVYEHTLSGGFMLYPQCLALVLKGCCTDNEIEAAGSQSKPMTRQLLHKLYKSQSNELPLEEWKSLVQKEIWNTAVQFDATLLRASQSKDKETDNFAAKLDSVCRYIKNIAHQAGLDVPVEEIALCTLSEMCPCVSYRASQMAAQILYANTNLVSVESAPLVGDLQCYAQLSNNGAVIVVEVPTLWWLVEELHVESHDIKGKIASVEVVYTAKIDLFAWSEGRTQSLPTIKVKLCKNTNEPSYKPFERAPKPMNLPKSTMGSQSTSQAAGQPQDSPDSPTSGIRKTFTKLTSKFSRKTTPGSSPTRKNAFHGEQSQQTGYSGTANQDRDSDQGSQSDCSNDGRSIDQNAKNVGGPAWNTKPGPAQTDIPSVNPTVTITTDSGVEEESIPESSRNNTPGVIGNPCPSSKQTTKVWKASDEQVQDVIDLLSGPSRSNKKNSKIGNPTGWHTIDSSNRYDNFNPCFVESDTIDRNTGSSSSACTWSTSTDSTGTRGSFGLGGQPGFDPEFAKYLETNIPGRRGRGHGSQFSNMSQVGSGHSWGMPDPRLNRSWPVQEANNNESVSWSTAGGSTGAGGLGGCQDSGSSSDESSSNNGENVFSMGLGLAGPDLVAAINRRRHSSGGEHENEDDHIKFLDVMMESKTTKTWPPKLLWQRGPPSKVPPFPTTNPNEIMSHDHLGLHPSLAAHWGDPMPHGSSVWSNQATSTQVTRTASPSPLAYRPSPANQHSPGHQKLDRRFAINMHNYQP